MARCWVLRWRHRHRSVVASGAASVLTQAVSGAAAASAITGRQATRSLKACRCRAVTRECRPTPAMPGCRRRVSLQRIRLSRATPFSSVPASLGSALRSLRRNCRPRALCRSARSDSSSRRATIRLLLRRTRAEVERLQSRSFVAAQHRQSLRGAMDTFNRRRSTRFIHRADSLRPRLREN